MRKSIYKSPVFCWKSRWVVKGTREVKVHDEIKEFPDYELEILEYNEKRRYVKKTIT